VQAEATGEHAVAESDLSDVILANAGGHRHAAHQLRPGLQVVLCEPAHHRPAGGSRRGVDLDHLVHRRSEQTAGVVVAEVGLLGERQRAQVFEAPEVAGGEAD